MAKKIATFLAAMTAAGIITHAAPAAEVKGGTSAPPTAGVAMQTEAFYRTVVAVTGTREATRIPGFAQALGEVLVKLTGDQTILADRRFPAMAAKAASLVTSFGYRDRLEGKPIHDEQGTYDRPHDLTVTFDQAKIDALVRKLGREPWLSPRPRVLVVVSVENIKATFMLARDGTVDRSADMREALAAAAEKAALLTALPTLAQLEVHGFTAKTLPNAAPGDILALARESGGDVAVVGHIVFREEALGWIVSWRMRANGKDYEWGTRGVNFDTAFRHALFGAAQIVSGHGKPK